MNFRDYKIFLNQRINTLNELRNIYKAKYIIFMILNR